MLGNHSLAIATLSLMLASVSGFRGHEFELSQSSHARSALPRKARAQSARPQSSSSGGQRTEATKIDPVKSGTCLSIAGGGYRSLVTAMGFADALRLFDTTQYNYFPRMVGTSGGSWGVYAICDRMKKAHQGIRRSTRQYLNDADSLCEECRMTDPHHVGMGGYRWLKRFIAIDQQQIPGASTYSAIHRTLWGLGIESALRSVGADIDFEDERDDACLRSLVITASGNTIDGWESSARVRTGEINKPDTMEDECGNRLKYCRSAWDQRLKSRVLTCDPFPPQTKNGSEVIGDSGIDAGLAAIFPSLITSSSAFTTGRFKEGVKKALKAATNVMGSASKLPKMHVRLADRSGASSKDVLLSDLGACDNNPWTELLLHNECQFILNIDTSQPEANNSSVFKISKKRASRMGWQELDTGIEAFHQGSVQTTVWRKRSGRAVPVINVDLATFPLGELHPPLGNASDKFIDGVFYTTREKVRTRKKVWLNIAALGRQVKKGQSFASDHAENYHRFVKRIFEKLITLPYKGKTGLIPYLFQKAGELNPDSLMPFMDDSSHDSMEWSWSPLHDVPQLFGSV